MNNAIRHEHERWQQHKRRFMFHKYRDVLGENTVAEVVNVRCVHDLREALFMLQKMRRELYARQRNLFE